MALQLHCSHSEKGRGFATPSWKRKYSMGDVGSCVRCLVVATAVDLGMSCRIVAGDTKFKKVFCLLSFFLWDSFFFLSYLLFLSLARELFFSSFYFPSFLSLQEREKIK